MKLIAGNANPPLPQAISNYLDMPLAKASIKRFADMEVFVDIDEKLAAKYPLPDVQMNNWTQVRKNDGTIVRP